MAYIAPTTSVVYRLVRLRKTVATWLAYSANALLFTALVLVVGVGSSLYAIDHGWQATTLRAGPWIMWYRAARADQDPYTHARLAKLGSLPLSTRIAATWEARFDADGKRLHSSCEYLLEGEPIDASWFSIAAFDDSGLLIPNAADRHAFTSQTLATNPDGSYFVVLARDARPGNWLPVGGAGRLTILITLIEPKPSVLDSGHLLPSIRRIRCR